MAHCNETFAENDQVYIRRPIPKVENFKSLKLCNYLTREKNQQRFNMKKSPQTFMAFAVTVLTKSEQKQGSQKAPIAPAETADPDNPDF